MLIIFTRGGNHCSDIQVFSAVLIQLFKHSMNFPQVLKKIIRDCLQEVDKRGLVSVTFPAIGTGYLNFPKDLVPKIMLEEAMMFCKKNSPQCLKEMVIIAHPADQESVKVREFQSDFSQYVSTVHKPDTMP